MRALFALGPHAGAHRVALRVGVSALVPLLLLWATGHQEWSLYAVFGGFTSFYGRNHVHLSRSRMQGTLAGLLTLVTAAGVVVGSSPHRSWLAIPSAAVVAGVGSLVSDVQDWHPPGPLWLVFAFSACAAVPSEPSDAGVALAVTGSSAGLAVLVGAAGSMRRRRRGDDRSPVTALAQGPHAGDVGRHLVRNALAVCAAGVAATGVGIGHPYWAMVAAVVPLATRDLGQQVVRGTHRVVGTALGLALAAVLLTADPGGLVLILVIVALLTGAELLVGRNYALAMVFVTPLALLMVHLVVPVPVGALLVDRGAETVIGVGVGLLVGFLTRRPQPVVAAVDMSA